MNLPQALVRRFHRIIQSVGATGGVYKGQGRNQCELMTRVTRNSSLEINNCNNLAQSRCTFKDYPDLPAKVELLFECNSVARVRPRTSKGITDLLLPQTSLRLHTESPSKKLTQSRGLSQLFSRLRSRSLTELTRQITPPTKNGHAPPPIESRKNFNLSILTMSEPGKFPRVGSN